MLIRYSNLIGRYLIYLNENKMQNIMLPAICVNVCLCIYCTDYHLSDSQVISEEGLEDKGM